MKLIIKMLDPIDQLCYMWIDKDGIRTQICMFCAPTMDDDAEVSSSVHLIKDSFATLLENFARLTHAPNFKWGPITVYNEEDEIIPLTEGWGPEEPMKWRRLEWESVESPVAPPA